MQDVYETIVTRRSTRKYKAQPVEEEKLLKVLEAGRHAPSGGNNQSTHLLVIRSRRALDELRDLAQEAFAAMEYDENTYKSLINSIRASKRGGYVFHYNAPVLIVAANRRGYGNAMADSSCCLENMMVMANALDLGSCWINQLHWLDENEKVRAYLLSLGLKENETVCGAISLGYADSETGLPPRTPVQRTGNPVDFIDD